MTSAPRSPARLAEDRERARKAQTAEWLERTLASRPPLSQAQADRLRPIFAPVRHLINGT